jgi:hypothetical protein
MTGGRLLALGIAVIVFLVSSSEIAFAEQEEAAIVAQIENECGLSQAALNEAEQLAARIYEAIGVRLTWVHRELLFQAQPGLRLRVLLLPRRMADRKIARERIRREVLGQANRPARLVYIFCARIGEASVKYMQEYTRLLGLVLAHEMGHVVLPVSSHLNTGIMREKVDVWSKTVKYFTAEQGDAIRSMLLPESQTESPDRPGLRTPNPEDEHGTEPEHELRTEHREA